MTFHRKLVAVISLLLAGTALGQSGAPPWDWATASPESQGMSGRKLEAMRDSLAARRTKALLVIRNDKILLEWYAPGHSAAKPHYTASMAKALVGGASLAVALSDGRIALDDKAAKFVSQWSGDPRKSRITIRQLGSHTSGIADAEANGLPHDRLEGWKGDFWKRLDPPRDPFTLSRDVAPTLFEPGGKLQYSNPGIAMLTYATTAALRNTPLKDIRSLLRDRVMRVIGVPDSEWSIGYGRTFTVDGLPQVASWGGAAYTARAVARVGRLMLRRGNWEGHQVIGAEAVRLVTSDAGTQGNCGMGWWSNNDGIYARIPKDAFWGSGAGHQVVLVVPSLNLIAVRNGEILGEANPEPLQYHEPVRTFFFEPLLDAMQAPAYLAAPAAPYPPSPIIRQIRWEPKGTIVRRAKGSDNWPMTWADDDAIYAAYGDGNGFEPFVPRKLSLGFTRVTGTPADFAGVNLRSETGEQYGDGPSGRKASGMLMVAGTLYLWARNAGNSQIAWSTDHAASWSWSDWKFTRSFGCPTFINFGINYCGARDGFVYVYSPDEDGAYRCADSLVLARVPSDRIRERTAYQFFQGLDSEGSPMWTEDLERRGAVFMSPGRCYRCGVSYNAALKRYLLVMTFPTARSFDPAGKVDTRFSGGLAVFDAPEPWGPWTTAFFSEPWDVGPGDTASFPTKWISRDGRTLHLVFSGDDTFSVRQAKFRIIGD